MNKGAIIGIIIAVVVIGGGVAYAVLHKSNNNSTTSSSSTTPSTSASTSSNSSSNTNSAATITYSDNGFSPATLTVKAGATVTIKNTSSSDIQFQSNPHPVHTDDPDLNVGSIAAGQTATFTANMKGTFGYHNHLNPSQGGTITIQ